MSGKFRPSCLSLNVLNPVPRMTWLAVYFICSQYDGPWCPVIFIHYKECDEITNPFPNFNVCTTALPEPMLTHVSMSPYGITGPQWVSAILKLLKNWVMTSGLAVMCVTFTPFINHEQCSKWQLRAQLILDVLAKLWVWEHDVQFSCAINQPLLAHHWRVHQCLLTSRFIAPSIRWGVSAPGGKMLKQLLKDHNFLNNSLIFIIESSAFNIFAFQKALHTIQFNLKSCFGFGERYLTP